MVPTNAYQYGSCTEYGNCIVPNIFMKAVNDNLSLFIFSLDAFVSTEL